jgi:hypothetical protein
MIEPNLGMSHPSAVTTPRKRLLCTTRIAAGQSVRSSAVKRFASSAMMRRSLALGVCRVIATSTYRVFDMRARTLTSWKLANIRRTSSSLRSAPPMCSSTSGYSSALKAIMGPSP